MEVQWFLVSCPLSFQHDWQKQCYKVTKSSPQAKTVWEFFFFRSPTALCIIVPILLRFTFYFKYSTGPEYFKLKKKMKISLKRIRKDVKKNASGCFLEGTQDGRGWAVHCLLWSVVYGCTQACYRNWATATPDTTELRS